MDVGATNKVRIHFKKNVELKKKSKKGMDSLMEVLSLIATWKPKALVKESDEMKQGVCLFLRDKR